MENNQECLQECPVCYEVLSGVERTLSCGHVFCHDCLVKTLVSINHDGVIRDKIACPVCRHLTFIKKQKEVLVSFPAARDLNENQTLEVPLSSPREPGSAPFRWMQNCRCLSQWARQRLTNPSHKACQVFIISTQGRPMAEEDALDVVTAVVNQRRRHRRRVCTTARCLLFLLSTFSLLALVATTLPWILLA